MRLRQIQAEAALDIEKEKSSRGGEVREREKGIGDSAGTGCRR
jgi:hypothetical protein